MHLLHFCLDSEARKANLSIHPLLMGLICWCGVGELPLIYFQTRPLPTKLGKSFFYILIHFPPLLLPPPNPTKQGITGQWYFPGQWKFLNYEGGLQELEENTGKHLKIPVIKITRPQDFDLNFHPQRVKKVVHICIFSCKKMFTWLWSWVGKFFPMHNFVLELQIIDLSCSALEM